MRLFIMDGIKKLLTDIPNAAATRQSEDDNALAINSPGNAGLKLVLNLQLCRHHFKRKTRLSFLSGSAEAVESHASAACIGTKTPLGVF